MNFGSILIRASGSPHLSKKARTTVAAPLSAGVNDADLCDGASKKAKAASRQQEKKKMSEKLQSLTGDHLDLITRKQEKKNTSLTVANLAGWAKCLSNDGNHEQALEIYEWIEKKKMTFSPSQLADFVELIGKING